MHIVLAGETFGLHKLKAVAEGSALGALAWMTSRACGSGYPCPWAQSSTQTLA